MRNQYGVWTQNRWLKSTHVDFFRDQHPPAPLEKQPYAKRLKALVKGKTLPKKHLKPQPFAVVKAVDLPESLYDKYSYNEWLTDIESDEQYLSIIPQKDPYRLERDLGIYGGGNIRYLYFSKKGKNVPAALREANFLMAADIGTRIRPTKYNQFSAVIEARFLNGPQKSDLEQGFTGFPARVKSAYLLADDLPYNTYVQGGLYRPMFGHFNVDHTSLAQELSGFNQLSVFKAFGVGGSPNVPFFSFNYIAPMSDGSYTPTSTNLLGSRDEGYTATIGGRFVTLGASFALSYWDTSFTDLVGLTLNRKMYSLTAGGAINRFIGNFELLRVDRQFSAIGRDAGNVYTSELKYRFWRENYLVANYAFANTSRALKEGSADEYMLGFKSFLISNLEIEGLMIKRTEKANNERATEDAFQLQLHAFW